MIECSKILNNITIYAETLDKQIQEIEPFKNDFNKINAENSKLINDLDKISQLNGDLKDELQALRGENIKLKDSISNSRTEISELSKTNQILIERLHETQEEYLHAYSASIEKNQIIASQIKLLKRSIKMFLKILLKTKIN